VSAPRLSLVDPTIAGELATLRGEIVLARAGSAQPQYGHFEHLAITMLRLCAEEMPESGIGVHARLVLAAYDDALDLAVHQADAGRRAERAQHDLHELTRRLEARRRGYPAGGVA